MDKNVRRAAEIMEQIVYATVATADESAKPWNSPVYYAIDDDLNLYWSSDNKGQHSKNISANSQAFIVIYDSTIPVGDGEGVYIEAKASEYTGGKTDSDNQRIQMVDWLANQPSPSKYKKYKAIPKRIWINDTEKDENGKYIRDIRIELSLKEVIAALRKKQRSENG